MKRWLVIVPGAAAAAVLAAACGSSSTGTPSGNSSKVASHPAGNSAAAAVSLKSISGIPGQALVSANGRTLYLFQADTNGTSKCSGACAAAWPPDTVTGTPKAEMGVKQNLLGTTHRSDGTTQVTYNHHPLYFYAGDTAAGTAHGQGLNQFGAKWYVLNASGSKIDTG